MVYVWMLLATLVTAQVSEVPAFPEGWQVRVDGSPPAGVAAAARGTDIAFVAMAPGWHITTGPAALFYRPAQSVAGAYTVTSETFLFDPGTRREGYGVVLGGRNLAAADPSYTCFLIRRTGEFLIERRAGATTTSVRDWTATPAIRKFDDRRPDERSVRNVLAVTVAADTTAFAINGTEVARVPTDQIDTAGVVGLRVGRQVNIHVTSVDVVQ